MKFIWRFFWILKRTVYLAKWIIYPNTMARGSQRSGAQCSCIGCIGLRPALARVFQRVSMNLNMTVGQAACQLLCRHNQSTLSTSCVCWIVPIATCDSIKRTCGCSCLKSPDQWHSWRVARVTDGWHQWHNWRVSGPCQTKCKNRAPT